jgi:hypothetical protein
MVERPLTVSGRGGSTLRILELRLINHAQTDARFEPRPSPSASPLPAALLAASFRFPREDPYQAKGLATYGLDSSEVRMAASNIGHSTFPAGVPKTKKVGK